MKIRYFIITMMLMLYPIFLQGAVEPKVIIEAKAAIRNVLNDPASAQFKDLQIKKGDVTWVSGLFNAKNGFGGYGNFEKFVYIPTYKQLILEKVQAEL
ncbi:MAG: hypothetical protein HGB14_04115, partial [Anaerolineaceae bacterium]|nr:hypothetical protein [Anaerolineaceae bacterium]